MEIRKSEGTKFRMKYETAEAKYCRREGTNVNLQLTAQKQEGICIE